jgi:hypothetical protein
MDMDTPLNNIDQATPEWLTQLLQKKRFLPQGEVKRVQQKLSQALITSIIAHLELSYSVDAPTSAPTRLFLKIAKPDFDLQISLQLGKFACRQVAQYGELPDAVHLLLFSKLFNQPAYVTVGTVGYRPKPSG